MISIVTPTLNPGVVLEDNLRSLTMQKADFEHIVQDGGSQDGTADLVARYATQYSARFYQEKDSSIYEGVLGGMAKARGDILAWLGADDFYMPWTLSTVEHVFARHPEIDWISGIPATAYNRKQIVRVRGIAPVYPRLFIRWGWYCPGRLGCLQQESMFWRRSLWEKAKPTSFLGPYKVGGDYHLWRVFAKHAQLWTVSTVFAAFSQSANQSGMQNLPSFLADLGSHAHSYRAAWWGRALRDIVSVLGNRRVVLPEADLIKDIRGI